MKNLEKYLINNKFEEQLSNLKNELKNKKIIVYGTGKLFQTIIEKYDLSDLDIIGVSDKKYVLEDEGKENFGYKIIPFCKLNMYEADCILLGVQNYLSLQHEFQKSKIAQMVLPLVKMHLKTKILYYWNKIPFVTLIKTRKNNTFVFIKSDGRKVYFPRIKNLDVRFWGTNSYVEIHEPFVAKQEVYISCYDNSKVIIKSHNNHKKTQILAGSNNEVIFGENTTTEGVRAHLFNGKNTKLIIGKDCMLSYDVFFKTNDIHTIYDINTRKLLNPARDIILGDHVWISAGVSVLKGVHIPSNCIVGAHSLVNKEFTEQNCIIAGLPAKIIKQGVNWDRRGPDTYESYN